jgi:hypothetical protein
VRQRVDLRQFVVPVSATLSAHCMRPSGRPGALVCIKLPGAYVQRLEERMHLVVRGVTQRLKIVELVAIACGQSATMCRATYADWFGPTRSLGRSAESDPGRQESPLTVKHEHRRERHLLSIGMDEDPPRSRPI